MPEQYARRYPIGAEVTHEGAHFRVWAPIRSRVEVVVEDGPTTVLLREADGYFAGFVAGVKAGARYRFQLDGGPPRPDPASRYQPEGPHGPSQVVDSSRFEWTDAHWPGVPSE